MQSILDRYNDGLISRGEAMQEMLHLFWEGGIKQDDLIHCFVIFTRDQLADEQREADARTAA